MVQPARLPAFWASANLEPSWQFKIWLKQFLMAITVKENVNPETMLEDPKEILEESPPRPKTPKGGFDATARVARDIRDNLDRDS